MIGRASLITSLGKQSLHKLPGAYGLGERNASLNKASNPMEIILLKAQETDDSLKVESMKPTKTHHIATDAVVALDLLSLFG